MQTIITSWPERTDTPTWISIGKFDGVHLGHQALIGRLKEEADQRGHETAVLTFWPHPRVFFNHAGSYFYLTTKEEREKLLLRTGIDQLFVMDFDASLASTEAEAFVDLLLRHYDLKGLVVGQNFKMGKDRGGTLDVLRPILQAAGAELIVVEPYMLEGERVSSERVRRALLQGEPELAARLLGRPYSLTSVVREGKKLGSKLGFPTANQSPPAGKLLPRYGVYATRVKTNGDTYMGVTSVGVRPTFEDTHIPNVETLILDFDGNLYGTILEVSFVQFLRDEIKFERVEDLIAQVEADKENARRILTHAT